MEDIEIPHLDYQTASMMRDQLRALRGSWIWKEKILPQIETRCADLMAIALEPVPNGPQHEDARYRLAEWRQFQAWMENAEANAAEIARVADPSLGAGEDPEV